MSCPNCTKRTLGLFIRAVTNTESIFAARPAGVVRTQSPRFFSTDRPSYEPAAAASRPPKPAYRNDRDNGAPRPIREKPAWLIHKEALREKLGGEAWNPRKKLSPDTMEGIRHLHNTQPALFTTPVLAQHFKVTPEAIRRILKSKWQPSDEEYEARMARWSKRGERIWTNLVEMGLKPPKAWRDMGVGRAVNGERPKWKSRHREIVQVGERASDKFEEEDILPIVDGAAWKQHLRQGDALDLEEESASDSPESREKERIPGIHRSVSREGRRPVRMPLSARL